MQKLKANDKGQRTDFAVAMLNKVFEGENFMKRVYFSDKASFSTSGQVNKHNVRIWGLQKQNCVREHVRDSSKVNV